MDFDDILTVVMSLAVDGIMLNGMEVKERTFFFYQDAVTIPCVSRGHGRSEVSSQPRVIPGVEGSACG